MPIQWTTRGTDLNKNSKLLQSLNIPIQPQPIARLVTDEAEEIRVTIYHQRREEGNRRWFLHHTALIYPENLGVKSLKMNVPTEVVKLVNFIRSIQTTHRQQKDFLSDTEPEWGYVPTTHQFIGWVVVRKIKRVGELSHTVPKTCVRLHLKHPLSLPHFNFLDRFSTNSQIRNFTKIRPMGAVLFHADGRTDTERTYSRSSLFRWRA
jgi:hypothetical protein